ncbi:MAG: GH39 family glycosyl hydrolase, partial [Isosphaeraceae bacterium]
VAVDDQAHTVRVAGVPAPAGGWKLAYDAPLPTRENPDAPGLFAFGGCYLRKFRPSGTPCYYWGRLDKEWDLVHRQGGRRIMVNFADAPGDLARDGRSWTTAKDLVEWHEVARAITGHLIDRYGADALSFTWSVFNEPDLGPLFWRADWDELQRFYDYAVDGILRAFEERGYDSDRVFVGGLELGGIFGTNLRLGEFLAHCSPRTEAKGALPKNAAFADQRLNGRRSRRVETLCRAHGGKGTPCDFISIHSYNRSEMMAAKLAKAKEEALRIDPDFYRGLSVNSHESCPDWMPPSDLAAADSYLGNGYFPTWCVDVCARQLRQATRDPRYASGETILTVWPPVTNFTGLNAVTRVLHHEPERPGGPTTTTVPAPVFHVLTLLSDVGDRFWSLPARQIGGHVVSGLAARDDQTVRVVLYSHNPEDTQSRSDTSFDVSLDLDGLGLSGPVRVEEVRFDRDHNTYFQRGRILRDRGGVTVKAEAARVDPLVKALEDRDPAAQRQALVTLGQIGPAAQSALPAVLRLARAATDDRVRDAAQAAVRSIFAPPSYTWAEIEEIRKLAECRPTGTTRCTPTRSGRLRITARIAGNGVDFLTIKPESR